MKTKQKRWEDLNKQEKTTGIIVTIVLVVVVFWGIGILLGKSDQSVENKPPVKATEKVKIIVTSQIVKKVEGKCRYFFDVRNNDTKAFNGSVAIELYNDEQTYPLGSDIFTASKPTQPGLGASVYVDTNTCPKSVDGATGMTKFKYTVKVDNNEVNNGEGKISDEFEDTNTSNF